MTVTQNFPDVFLDVYVDSFVAEKIAPKRRSRTAHKIEARYKQIERRNNTARQSMCRAVDRLR